MDRRLYKVVNAFGDGDSLEYYILKGLKTVEEKSAIVHGIELRKGEEACVVSDISADQDVVEILVEKFIENTVTPTTLKDIVQDFVENGDAEQKKTD